MFFRTPPHFRRRSLAAAREPATVAARLLVLLALFLGASPATANERTIPFRSGPVVAEIPTGQTQRSPAPGINLADEARHVVVQFEAPVDPEKKKDLDRAGLDLLNPLTGSAYFAAIDSERLDTTQIRSAAGNLALLAIQPEWKADPSVTARAIPEYAVVDRTNPDDPVVAAYLLFHPDVDIATEGSQVINSHGVKPVAEIPSLNGLVINLPLSHLDGLIGDDAVMWVEWPLPPMSGVNDSNRVVTEVDTLQAAPYGLDGTGITVLVYDGGYARATHDDFGGRLTVFDSSGLSDHATHVAGTIGGNGISSGGTYKGMAPNTTLLSYGFQYDGSGTFLYSNPGDISSDYNQAINTHGADLSNNSIGTNTEPNGFACSLQGNYGVTSALIDSIVAGSLGAPFRVIWANGNERQGSRCDVEGYGDYYSTAPPAGAKNHIAIGALNSNNDTMTSFSSWGPVDDGRMKPDVSGPGCQSSGDFGVTSVNSTSDTAYLTICGTSMAAPTVTGIAALLLQDFRANNPAEPDPRNSTLKTLFAHNAVDLGNAGPDYQVGYGSVRGQQTIDFMRSGNFLEDEIDQGQTFTVLVPVSASDTELKVTIAWDDVAGTPNVNPALVNDLDLRVISPSSTTHYPWTLNPTAPSNPAVQTQPNHVDNIEQVLVSSPAAGVWQVEVTGFSVPQGPQSFSLAASPSLTACSSAGYIVLDQAAYACDGSVTVTVNDCDLNTDDGTVQSASIQVASTTEPGGETVTLTETGAATAVFTGSISLATANSVGVLQAADSGTLTATYLDADDGQGGSNLNVTASAAIDCTAPVISNIQTTNIGTTHATASFDTDEAANGTVSFGQSCGALTQSASDSGFPTAHAISLSGLTSSTTYYYSVGAEDQATNSSTDDNGGACHSFLTPDTENYFTELFASNDLDNLSLTFTPDGSGNFYCGATEAITSLPIDPSGGTQLFLSDDDSDAVNLGSSQVSLYGTSYSTFFVGSNGYLTFTAADTDWDESLVDHFSVPRISALFDDFNPSAGGIVSWQSLSDRAVVTWQGVPEYGTSSSNTFQVEMHFDGTIVLSYLGIAASDGLAGLSEGTGQPTDFGETDLSALAGCACTEDDDSDGICNDVDNCLDVANPLQVDSNQDGYGNFCDPDLNNDGVVGIPDFNAFRLAFSLVCADPSYDADADFNSDCAIGIPDFNIFRTYFGGMPGPSGYSCAGSPPCPTSSSTEGAPGDPSSSEPTTTASSDGGGAAPDSSEETDTSGAGPESELGAAIDESELPVGTDAAAAVAEVPALAPIPLASLGALVLALGLVAIGSRRRAARRPGTPGRSRTV